MEEHKLHDNDECYRLQKEILSKGSIENTCNSPLKGGDAMFGCIYLHLASAHVWWLLHVSLAWLSLEIDKTWEPCKYWNIKLPNID